MVKHLGLSGRQEIARIGTWHAEDPSFKTTRVACEVAARDDGASFQLLDCYTVPSLNLSKRPVLRNKLVQQWPHLSGIPFANDVAEVKLLIGSDHIDTHEIYEYRVDSTRSNAPRGILTAFGWSVAGQVAGSPTISQCHRVTVAKDTSLSELLKKFLLFDDFGAQPLAQPPIGNEERRARQILHDTIRYVGDRYEAGLLWRSVNASLPDNHKYVLKRFENLLKRLGTCQDLANKYVTAMEEYIQLGHARKLTEDEIAKMPAGRTWFLPHHPVINPRIPDKCRLVFDAAASFQGVSLNSKLLRGEVDLVNLVGVLLRFRERRVALCADIIKMFHQVRVREIDFYAFCFYWKTPDSAEPPAAYKMDVQVFGSVCSPAICAHVLRRAAMDAGDDADIAIR